MNPSEGPERESDRKEWMIAWALALAIHVFAFLGFGFLRLQPSPPPDKPEPVDLVILPDSPENFAELPPDRADAAPEHPDFLSNVTSRAKDLVPGGDAALPHMQGDGAGPALDPNQAAPQSPSATTPAPPTNDPALESSPPASDRSIQGPSGTIGNSDINQPEMDNPDGNAGLTGDVSLSTTDWNYSPWLQRFGRELMHHWIAPPAYYMGLLKDGGFAVIDVEISRSGQLLNVQLRDQKGHASLIIAAHSAVRSMNPVEALPADFPDQTLILHIKMVYPKYESQPARTRRSR